MPDQKKATQNQNPVNSTTDQPADRPASQPPMPAIFPQSDLPPLPPEFQNLQDNNIVKTPEEKPPEKPVADSTGSSAPPDVHSVASKPKKKFGGGKIIATILGLILLAGGVGAGVFLTQQKQLVNQKAGSCEANGEFTCNCKCYSTCVDGSVAGQCNAICAEKDPTCNTAPPSGGSCSNTGAEDGCTGRSPGDTYCSPLQGTDVPLLRTCYFVAPGTSNHMCDNTIGAACGPGNCAINPHTGQYPPGCTPPPTGPPPTVTPTPTPSRPNLCSSSTVDKSTLAPGETVVMSSVSNSPANDFTYAVYNVDNPYSPNNPKPVCVTSGGDVTTEQDTCPTGTHHLIFMDTNTNTRTTGSRSVKYEDLFVVDKNWSDKQVTHVQINAYFKTTAGLISTPQPACVASVTIATSAPYCESIDAYDTAGNPLTNAQLSALTPGTTVSFCAGGIAASGSFDKGQFTIDGTQLPETTNRNSRGDFCQSYTILPTDTTVTVTAKVHHLPDNQWY